MTSLPDLRPEAVEDFKVLFGIEDRATTIRCLAAFFLLLLTFTFGAAPVGMRWVRGRERMRFIARNLRDGTRYNSFTSTALCACAGLFLSLLFTDLLPSARYLVDINTGRPDAEILVILGFLLVKTMQTIVSMRFGNKDPDYVDMPHLYVMQFIRCESNVAKTIPSTPRRFSVPEIESDIADEDIDNEVMDVNDIWDLVRRLEMSYEEALELKEYALQEAERPTRRTMKYLESRRDYLRALKPKMGLITYTGVYLLSLHMVFDGFCMGLQRNEKLIWYTFGNIFFHRALIAMMTGIDLVAANFKTKSILIVIGIISVMTPLGSLIGLLVLTFDPVFPSPTLLFALSAGSLLYVIVFELFRGQKQHVTGAGQCVGTFFGFFISLMLCLWTRGIRIYS